MDKTPWIPNPKTTKTDLKRILQIMGVEPPDGYNAKELRELVTETHTEFMSLIAEGGRSAAAAAADRLAESAIASSAAAATTTAESASASSAAAATGIVVSHLHGFEVDFDDPPLSDAATAATSHEHYFEQLDLLTFQQFMHKKSIKNLVVPRDILEDLRNLNVEGNAAVNSLIMDFMRDYVNMQPQARVDAFARLCRAIRAIVHTATRGGTDDI